MESASNLCDIGPLKADQFFSQANSQIEGSGGEAADRFGLALAASPPTDPYEVYVPLVVLSYPLDHEDE